MKILFDQGTPVPLREQLPEHEIHTAYELEWPQMRNGELLNAAEKKGYGFTTFYGARKVSQFRR